MMQRRHENDETILVLNAGSSSIEFSVFDVAGAQPVPTCRTPSTTTGATAMRKSIAATIVAAALLVPTVSTVYAVTAQVVEITLSDPSTDPAIAGMQMTAEPSTVKAGRVTLNAVNRSKDLVHEVLVIPAPPNGKKLPYDTKKDIVLEKRAHARGEVSDLKPGARGSTTLSLKPGTYLLVCNQPGHYKSGMYTRLVVEK
jgi:uncharacterized cupredoxin-like copper-binding protein